VLVDMGPGVARMVRIERIHSNRTRASRSTTWTPMSFVDLNRTGVALMEIVSRPDIRGPEEAAAYVAKLRQILRYLGTCDGNMQNGNLRADVNVSVCRPGAYERFRETGDFTSPSRHALRDQEHELHALHPAGHRLRGAPPDRHRRGRRQVVQETRLYDPDKGETRSMRSKEEAHDYRYFPDPDLLPLEIEQAWVDEIAARLPELPDAKKARFVADYGLTEYDASVLTADVEAPPSSRRWRRAATASRPPTG
jgi:aspartyl-tRNA(Asn)/glutamyl-tRNA(Gln) amidotransferase subunit B